MNTTKGRIKRSPFLIKNKNMKKKYLIHQIWIDPMENNNAYGYDIIGYVNTLEGATFKCNSGRIFTQKDCWAIREDLPEFKFTIVFEL